MIDFSTVRVSEVQLPRDTVWQSGIQTSPLKIGDCVKYISDLFIEETLAGFTHFKSN